jgi:hypothetical protein
MQTSMDFKSDPKLFIRQLGGGLVLRHGSTRDADSLAEFNGANLGSDPQDSQRVAAMTRDLLTRPHASLSPGDFTIVEDPSSGRIVSSLCLISQTWSYEGVEFGLGRPEYVATDPAYRKRGLVRARFDVIHRWSAERGQVAVIEPWAPGHAEEGSAGFPGLTFLQMRSAIAVSRSFVMPFPIAGGTATRAACC